MIGAVRSWKPWMCGHSYSFLLDVVWEFVIVMQSPFYMISFFFFQNWICNNVVSNGMVVRKNTKPTVSPRWRFGHMSKGGIRICLPVHCLSARPDRHPYSHTNATSPPCSEDQIVRDNRLPVHCRHLAPQRHRTVIPVATQMSLPLVCLPPVLIEVPKRLRREGDFMRGPDKLIYVGEASAAASARYQGQLMQRLQESWIAGEGQIRGVGWGGGSSSFKPWVGYNPTGHSTPKSVQTKEVQHNLHNEELEISCLGEQKLRVALAIACPCFPLFEGRSTESFHNDSGVAPANQTKERAKTKSSWISPIFVNSGVFPLGKQARFTLNFCSGMPPGKVHEPAFLWFGFAGATPEWRDKMYSQRTHNHSFSERIQYTFRGCTFPKRSADCQEKLQIDISPLGPNP